MRSTGKIFWRIRPESQCVSDVLTIVPLVCNEVPMDNQEEPSEGQLRIWTSGAFSGNLFVIAEHNPRFDCYKVLEGDRIRTVTRDVVVYASKDVTQ
jgi:hypothetical protein